jgi:hypothetical protein
MWSLVPLDYERLRRNRHLNEVERRAVERPVAADAHWNAACFDDDLDVVDTLGDCLRRGWGLKGRDAVNLRSVKDGECSQHRNSPRLGAIVRRFVLDFDRLVEIDGVAFSPLRTCHPRAAACR